MKEYIGIDIGGTKCAVVRGNENGTILDKIRFQTEDKENTLHKLFEAVSQLLTDDTVSIGVSCGGPLDSKKGVILGPPNLPGWDCVPVTDMLFREFGRKAYLQNDADACALAEWKFGAGKGSENLIFLTFGTGMGAGLILNGRLYSGARGMAGEIGHVRLYEDGHKGYGKTGSFEGYCSGGGIAQYGLGTAEELAGRAVKGDSQALEIWKKVGADLGRLLSTLMDVLNPEVIVIGSIYVRAGAFLEESMREMLKRETLAVNLESCQVVPAKLGEALGDVAALCVAMQEG